jgi:SPP1 gp7 family putative phage head morphogenesis protein
MKRDFAADAERRSVREVAALRAQNAQLRVDSRRYQLLRRRLQRDVQAGRTVIPPSFVPVQPVDPRPAPTLGSKVLPPLSPPLALGVRMGAAIGAELRAMAVEARALIRALQAQSEGVMPSGHIPNTTSVMPGVVSGGQHAMDVAPGEREFEALRARWAQRFETLARGWARRLVGDVTAQSTAQLAHGLRDVATLMQIESTLQTPRMRALVDAAAEASVGLITRIPQRFLGDVQTQVMNAVTTGSGLNKLVPYLTKRYKGDARHAHLVALDQIRKVSESVNAARLQSLGVEEYVWVATGGERYPRKLHHERLNGRTFRYDDPPVIDERTGERGKPGDAINCRCRQRPILNFMKMVAQ